MYYPKGAYYGAYISYLGKFYSILTSGSTKTGEGITFSIFLCGIGGWVFFFSGAFVVGIDGIVGIVGVIVVIGTEGAVIGTLVTIGSFCISFSLFPFILFSTTSFLFDDDLIPLLFLSYLSYKNTFKNSSKKYSLN